MISRSRISTALLIVGAALLIAPAVAPVQSVLFHEVRGEFTMSEAELEDREVTVVAYGNLSDRGKELYERALRNDGSYQVPAGAGASDFEYRTDPDAEDDARGSFGPRAVAIERPDDPDFPSADEQPAAERRPPDERQAAGGTAGAETGGESVTGTQPNGTADRAPEQRREDEYNLLTTRLGQPPLTDTGNLLRFVSVLAGVVMVGGGGYLRSKP